MEGRGGPARDKEGHIVHSELCARFGRLAFIWPMNSPEVQMHLATPLGEAPRWEDTRPLLTFIPIDRETGMNVRYEAEAFERWLREQFLGELDQA